MRRRRSHDCQSSTRTPTSLWWLLPQLHVLRISRIFKNACDIPNSVSRVCRRKLPSEGLLDQAGCMHVHWLKLGMACFGWVVGDLG